jgi:hypothetical protein
MAPHSPQFHGNKKSAFPFKVPVPKSVRKAALLALELRDTYDFKGATETGWKRANQLATESEIAVEDFRFIKNWFARHIYVSKPGYDLWVANGAPKDKKWASHRAICAWLTWGGNAGLAWIAK